MSEPRMESGKEYPASRVEWVVSQVRRGHEAAIHSEEEYRQVMDQLEKEGLDVRLGSSNRITATLIPDNG